MPEALNGRCWARALWKHDLDKGLADCEAALKLGQRRPEMLQSRGFVHLDRGEFDLALADYDAGLRQQPKAAWSLYGRGLAKLRKGDKAGGDADIQSAVGLEPQLAAQAKQLGFQP